MSNYSSNADRDPDNRSGGHKFNVSLRRMLNTPLKPHKEKPPPRGGPKGPEPTRYGDWEKKGIASDF